MVVSTLMEAWQVVQAGLVKDGTVKDVCSLSNIFRSRLTVVRRFSMGFLSASTRSLIFQNCGTRLRKTGRSCA